MKISIPNSDASKKPKMEKWRNIKMYSTFQTVFNYLLDSNKIARDSEKKICWIWNPELIKRYLADPSLVVR